MSGRVLNFSEFFDKYSKDTNDNKKSIDSFTNSASNFEVGFDQDTYSQTQIGPNRPISSNTEVTPPQPGEKGTKFKSAVDSEMDAPIEEIEDEPKTEIDETPEPEAGSNPKKADKKMSETINFELVKGFTDYVNEFNGAEYVVDADWVEDRKNDPFAEHDSEVCPDCGVEIENDDQGIVVCGCNM